MGQIKYLTLYPTCPRFSFARTAPLFSSDFFYDVFELIRDALGFIHDELELFNDVSEFKNDASDHNGDAL